MNDKIICKPVAQYIYQCDKCKRVLSKCVCKKK